MLRDMEELLNSVYDDDVRAYLKEALKCYMSGSYRACVIMSVIAGGYDLHKKVKSLAGSNNRFKELDDEIEKKKSALEVYEKYLVEQCATEEIDMLNNNELKELQRCLDTRNDCAHPSNFICSPEKARDVYSSIIDILAAKPVLFGCKHMKNVIDEMEEKTFFPVIDSNKMKVIVEDKLGQFQKKAIEPLLKSIGNTIKNTKSTVQKDNAMRFLALSTDFISERYENFITDFIEKDQYEGELLRLLDINIDILIYLSDINIEKIICKLETNLTASEISNIEVWIKIILSDKLQDEKFIGSVAKNITSFKDKSLFTDSPNSDVRFQLVYSILQNEKCLEKFRNMIRNGCYKQFNLAHFEEFYLQNILIQLDDNILYETWLKAINCYINSSNFNYGNRAVNVFTSIAKEYWIDKVSLELKISLVMNILRQGKKDSNYYSHDCAELMWNLDKKYPKLVETFLDHIFENKENNDINEFLVDKYAKIISRYIVSYESKTESIINQLIELRDSNLGAKSILDEIKEVVVNSFQDEFKKSLLPKL
ncbi:hypothetical protein [Aminipila sp.]|uniref:hypothetical protein n=1 Tax=Aminipila sp. TaxID=2060095 RepID=UPI00289C655D|nr:hypothetical protein [Aminipila sp.]